MSTSATVAQIISQVQTYIATLDSIRNAPNSLPETVNVLTSICYMPSDRNEFGPTGVRKSLGSLAIEILVPLKNRSRDYLTVAAYLDSVPNLLMNKLLNDNQWNGKIDTFDSIDATWLTPTIDNINYIGYRFTVNGIKRLVTLT